MDRPEFSPAERARLTATEPAGLRAFETKIASARATARRTDRVSVRLTNDWDKKRFRRIQSACRRRRQRRPTVPGSWLGVTIDDRMPSADGPEHPPAPQHSNVELEPVFFVDRVDCRAGMRPVRIQSRSQFTSAVNVANFARALGVRDSPIRRARWPCASTSAVKSTGLDSRAGFSAGGRRLRSPAAGQDVGVPARSVAAGDGRSNARLSLDWACRELARARVHQLRRRPRRVGNRRRTAAAVLLAQLSQRDAVAHAAQRRPIWCRGSSRSSRPTLRAAAGPGYASTAQRDGRRDPVARPRSPHGARVAVRPDCSGQASIRASRSRSRMPVDYEREVDDRAGHQSRNHRQGQPAVDARLRHAPGHRRAVPEARVSILGLDNKQLWRGTTGRDGVALAPPLPLRKPDDWYRLSFVVTAEKDGDIAYVGIELERRHHAVGLRLRRSTCGKRRTSCADRCSPIAASTSPARRCTSKAIIRADTPTGIRLLPAGSTLDIRVRDSRYQGRRPPHDHDQPVEQRRVDLDGAAGGHARQLLDRGDAAWHGEARGQ